MQKEGRQESGDDVSELGFGGLKVENNVDGIRNASVVVNNE